MTSLAKFRLLSGSQRCELVSAMALLPIVWLALRALGLPRVCAWLPRQITPMPAVAALTQARETARAVNIAAAHSPFPVTCLTRSLLLQWMLARRGIDCVLRIGVRIDAGHFRAHAWLEYEGAAVNDAPEVTAQFSVFPELVALAKFD